MQIQIQILSKKKENTNTSKNTSKNIFENTKTNTFKFMYEIFNLLQSEFVVWYVLI